MRVRVALGALLAAAIGGATTRLEAAKISSVGILDRDHLVVHVLDGEVAHGEGAGETVIRYPELDVGAAVQTGTWKLRSSQDAAYSGAGRHPVACHRKKKLSGHAQMEWSGSDFRYEYTYQHWIYLRLPSSLQQGSAYTLEIAADGSIGRVPFTFDVFSTRSEAVHVNLAGYAPDAPHKAADLYYWLGDGGARDYSSFVGNAVYVYDVANAQAHPAGQVSFGKASGDDVFWYNLTRSAVWNADFSDFSGTGTYRLAIEGVGCSQDFRIASDVYADPFRVSLRGFFYMRIGQQNPMGIQPPPRTPLYIPGVSPPTTTVYLTEMQPWHPEWSTFASGDPWDQPNSWAPFRKAGHPTNPGAWGGHSDAADWDRHLGHVSIIYDMLLPYLLTGGAIDDDDTGIAESGNGIPDLLDEARNEVDFWLRLRDGAGYGHGLTNPNGSDQLFQAGPTAIAAWANAANAAMLADAFRLAGLTSLVNGYRDAAVAAYGHANGLPDPMLDETQAVGDVNIRGRDLKMTAAAFLYNVTGDQAYEAVVDAESVCTSGAAELEDGTRDQVWATAGYLLTPRTVHFPALWADMKASVINEARDKEADLAEVRPSRRATDDRTGYFRTAQNVQRTMIAHAVADDPSDRDLFRRALDLEAGWGLGRNPLNLVEMSTASTPLSSKRSVESMYTSGRDDGVAGVHPGHTPYLNLDDWYPGMVMGTPSRLYENGYPPDFKNTWPIGEGYFDSPWVWAHSEFTPQQTMRGKMALLAYLHGLSGSPDPTRTLDVGKSATGGGTVTSSPPGIDCGPDCSEAYAAGTVVTLSAAAEAGSTFAGWSGACSGTGACVVTMSAARSVTAAFDLVTHALAVTKAGAGSGTVTSSPPGIHCGGDCGETYVLGTSVTNVRLAATAEAGSTFAGWSGACSGTGACSVTMSAARSVTATFSPSGTAATIYGDALASDWADWSWSATVDFAGTSPVKAGTRAINVAYQGWGGLSLRKGTALGTAGYGALKFWVYGGTGSDKSLRVTTQTGDTGGESSPVMVTAVADAWAEVTVPMGGLGNPPAIKRLNIMNFTADTLPTVTFDEIRLE
jgi:hypothetical protein